MTTIRQRILILAAVLAFFSPALRAEQPQKASRATQEDRLKKLEERADAAEKAAGLISGIRCGWFSPFRLRLLVKSARWLPWWSSPLLQRV